MKTSLIIFLCLIATIGFIKPASAQDLEQQFDALLDTTLLRESPGATALVVKEGKILYKKAFGLSDLELKVQMNPDNVFRIGSITKQFSACAIMKLIEQGKLSLKDSIAKFINDYPAPGKSATIEQLLTHTSGIKNITSMQSWTSEVQRKDFTPKDVVDFFKNETPDFSPGTGYRYSNSNYILLGYIIELVSGTTYEKYLNENFFRPLGMAHTRLDDFSAVIEGRTKGYRKTNGQYGNADFLSMTLPFSAGAILSNTSDLYTWYDAVMNDKVISKTSREKAHTSFRLGTGELTAYGYGWEVGNIQGSPSVKHGGKINGFVTYSLYLPNEKTFVAIFSNCDCTNDLDNLASRIAAITIGKPYEWHSIPLNKDKLAKYEGTYESEKRDERIVSLEGGRLLYFAPKWIKTPLVPFGKDKFHVENTLTTLEFHRDHKGKINSFETHSPERVDKWVRTEKEVVKMKAIKVSPHAYDQYVGRYRIGSEYFMVIKEGGKLYGKAPGDNQIRQEILPSGEHLFFAKNLDAKVRFNVDGKGKVISLTIIQNGEKTATKTD